MYSWLSQLYLSLQAMIEAIKHSIVMLQISKVSYPHIHASTNIEVPRKDYITSSPPSVQERM